MDSKLLLKIREKHQKSFEALFHLYYEPLVIHAQHYFPERSSCEDIVQEVFIYLWENADSMSITVSLKGYLYKMVKNRMLNHLRTLKENYDLEVLDYESVKETYEEFEYIQDENNLKLSILFILIDDLPKRMKEIFILKHRRNLSYSEISEHLEISLNTVKTQLKRAKIILQSQIPFFILLIYLNI